MFYFLVFFQFSTTCGSVSRLLAYSLVFFFLLFIVFCNSLDFLVLLGCFWSWVFDVWLIGIVFLNLHFCRILCFSFPFSCGNFFWGEKFRNFSSAIEVDDSWTGKEGEVGRINCMDNLCCFNSVYSQVVMSSDFSFAWFYVKFIIICVDFCWALWAGCFWASDMIYLWAYYYIFYTDYSSSVIIWNSSLFIR